MIRMVRSELILLLVSLTFCVNGQNLFFGRQGQLGGNVDEEPFPNNNLPNGGNRNPFQPPISNEEQSKPSPEDLVLIKECNCEDNRVPICGSDGITYHNPCVYRCKRPKEVSCRCRGVCGTCRYPCEDNPTYSSQCPSWAQQGTCENDTQFMEQNCRHSCGICTLPVCYRLGVLASRDISTFCRQKF